MFTFAEYASAAARTEVYTVTDWRQQVPVVLYRGLHGQMGLASEITELLAALKQTPHDPVNICEEMGDLWWYAALWYRLCISLPDARGNNRLNDVEFFVSNDHPFARDAAFLELRTLSGLLGEAADLCKRSLYYGKRFEPGHLPDREVIISLQRLTMFTGCDLQEVWKVNIAKLWARFPEKFDGEMAINRDTKTELLVMVEKRKELKRIAEEAKARDGGVCMGNPAGVSRVTLTD